MFDPILWSDLPWGTSVHVPISVSIGFFVSTKADAPSHHNFFLIIFILIGIVLKTISGQATFISIVFTSLWCCQRS